MLHKKLISLLLIVGLFSSATMHPIWGFDWLFGSSNQTTVNTQKRNDLLFMGSVAAVLGIGIYARYYWNKNKISTQFKHTKESSTPSKHTRELCVQPQGPNLGQYADNNHNYVPVSLLDDGDDHISCVDQNRCGPCMKKDLLLQLDEAQRLLDEAGFYNSGVTNSRSHPAVVARPQEPGLVQRDWANVPDEERKRIKTDCEGTKYPISLGGQRRRAATAPVVPALGYIEYASDCELTV